MASRNLLAIPGGEVDVRCEVDSISHGDHNVVLDQHIVCGVSGP